MACLTLKSEMKEWPPYHAKGRNYLSYATSHLRSGTNS
jgi:hypothetical protein